MAPEGTGVVPPSTTCTEEAVAVEGTGSAPVPVPLRPPDVNRNDEVASYLTSGDPRRVVSALNTLLEVSFDHERNFCLGFDGGKTVGALVWLFEQCLLGGSGSGRGRGSGTVASSSTVSSPTDPHTHQRRRRCRFLGSHEEADQMEREYRRIIERAWHDAKSPDETETTTQTNNEEEEDDDDDDIDSEDDVKMKEEDEWYDRRLKKWYLRCESRFASLSSTTPSTSLLLLSLDHRRSRSRSPKHRRRRRNRVRSTDFRTMESIVMILRNLSFVAANGRHLAYHTGVLRLLGACLRYPYSFAHQPTAVSSSGGSGSGSGPPSVPGHGHDTAVGNTSACLHAIQTLTNLSPFLDTTGTKLFTDLTLLDEWDLASTSASTSRTSPSTNHHHSHHHPCHQEPRLPQALQLGLGGLLLAKQFVQFEGGSGGGGGGGSDNPMSFSSTVPPEVVHRVVWPHRTVVLSLFSQILPCILQNTNRSIVVAALEFLKELMLEYNHPTTTPTNGEDDDPDNGNHNHRNHQQKQQQQQHQQQHAHPNVFCYVPDQLLERLVDLLSLPRLGPDSLGYIDPATHTVSRVTALKLGVGYDAVVDFELRDRSADLLERLCGYHDGDIVERLATLSSGRPSLSLYESLVDMLSTTVGRSDAPHQAGSLLVHLANGPGLGLARVESKLLALASRDANVAHIVCNSLLN